MIFKILYVAQFQTMIKSMRWPITWFVKMSVRDDESKEVKELISDLGKDLSDIRYQCNNGFRIWDTHNQPNG